MNEKEKEYFEKFKSNEINEADLEKGKRKAKNLGKNSNNLLLLIDMITDSMNGKFKIPAWAVAIIVGAIVYVVSPIDAVPDIIPVLGWLDDGAVVSAAIGSLVAIIAEYNDYRNNK